MTSRRRFLVGVGTSLALVGCGYRPGGGDVRWQRRSANHLTGKTRVVATDHRVYAFDYDATLINPMTAETTVGSGVDVVDASDGSHAWSRTYESRMSCSAVGDAGVVVCVDNTLVQPTGTDQQRVDLPGSAYGVALADGRAYVRLQRELVAIDLDDGSVRWSHQLPWTEESTVLANRETVLVADESRFVGVDADGTPRWRRDDLGSVVPAVTGDGVYATSRERVLALDASSGETRWADDAETTSPPVVTDDRVLYRANGALVAVDHGGDQRWRFSEFAAGGDLPVAADERGVFAATETGIAAIESGEPRWEVAYDRIGVGPFLVDAGVIAGSGARLVCHVP